MTIQGFANSAASAALYELGEPRWGPVFEITAEHIAQIMQQGKWRTNTQPDYSKWCECVRHAAMNMAQDGQLPRGPRLEMLSGMYYTR